MIVILRDQKKWRRAGAETLKSVGYNPDRPVFIKPNIGATSKVVNTDPEFVRGMIYHLKSMGLKGGEITVGDGAVVTEYESSKYNFDHLGWTEMCRDEEVNLVDLNTAEREQYGWSMFNELGFLSLPKIMRGKDYINVAKMKTHMQTQVSLCSKNQKGLLSPEVRKAFHKIGLHKPIYALSEAVIPRISIVEGIMGVEGDGPGDLGTGRYDGLVVAGSSMVQVDWTACSIMGIDPRTILHLKDGEYIVKALTSVKNLPQIRPYKLPNREFKMLNVHMCPSNGCTACMSSVGKLNKYARQKGGRKALWFVKHGVLERLDIVIGRDVKPPKNHGYLIFYGDCSKSLAEAFPEYPFIPGCPPVSAEAFEELVKR